MEYGSCTRQRMICTLVPFITSKELFVTLQLPLPLGLLKECQKHVFHIVLPISANVLKHFHGMKTDHTNKIQWLVESLILSQELFRWIFFFSSAIFMVSVCFDKWAKQILHFLSSLLPCLEQHLFTTLVQNPNIYRKNSSCLYPSPKSL